MADKAGDGQGTRASGRSLISWADPTARDVDIIMATVDREIWYPTSGPGKELDDDDEAGTHLA